MKIAESFIIIKGRGIGVMFDNRMEISKLSLFLEPNLSVPKMQKKEKYIKSSYCMYVCI